MLQTDLLYRVLPDHSLGSYATCGALPYTGRTLSLAPLAQTCACDAADLKPENILIKSYSR